jgi:predicted DNA-binding protein with PD1-like motif
MFVPVFNSDNHDEKLTGGHMPEGDVDDGTVEFVILMICMRS